MSWFRRLVTATATLLCTPLAFGDGQGLVLGFGGEGDTAGGRAATLFADVGLGSRTWISGMLATARTGGGPATLETRYADLAMDHWFAPVGVRLGAGYWGDDNILDSKDLRGSLYFRNEAISLSANYERREFDFTFSLDLLRRPRVVEFYSDGYGANARFKVNDTVALSLDGMIYDYSRDINLQPNIDILRIFSTSRLALMNSLLDYRVGAGIDWTFGLRNVDLRVEQWQTAIDQGRVDSIGIGFLTPTSDFNDVEFRASFDYSEDFGKTMTFSVYFYFYRI